MYYPTIESIDEEIKEIKNMIRELIEQESFFLKKSDIEIIEKGRLDWERGKTISGEQLIKKIE